MSRRRAVAHSRDSGPAEIDPGRINQLVRDQRNLVWLDIEDPTEDDIKLLWAEFGFHELALEDAFKRGQRPKVDEYPGYYFIVLYAAGVDDGGRIEPHEIHCFWGANFLVTLHSGAVAEIDSAIDRWAAGAEDRRHGVAYQVYALLDAIVDSYFPALDGVSDRIDALEERLLGSAASLTAEVLSLRRELISARRLLGPSRDVLTGLIRRDVPIFPPALVPHLVDVHDHAIRAIDTLDVQRELLANAIEAQLSATNNRLNQSMLRLTALTVCLAIPVLIAGLYGMNYELFPPQGGRAGFWIALGMMTAAAGVVAVLFKRAGWL